MNSLIESSELASVLVTGSAIYKPKGCKRYTGAPLPPCGTPTVTRSLGNLNERLERLAYGERLGGQNSPPLVTYETSPGPYGDVVRATEEYVRWFRRTYPAAGREDHARVQAPGPAPKGVGGTEDRPSPLDRFKSP